MPKKSKPQIWIEYGAARFILGFFSALPRRLSINFGIALARLAYLFLGKLRRVGRRNLAIAFPEKSAAEHEKILKTSFENLGRTLGEVSQFPLATAEKLEQLVKFEFGAAEQAFFDAERAKGRGFIIVSPHLGNWEMMVFAYSALREPVNYLARPLDNPLIEEMTVRLRTRFGNRPINKNDSVTKALEILRSGGILGILADVNVHPKEGVFVPFFGIPACTSSGVALLALRTNSLIVPLCGVWDAENNRYKVMHGKILDPVRTGDRQTDIVETTARFTAEVEKFIRAYPEQWLWIHKRWKTRPPGEKDLYANL